MSDPKRTAFSGTVYGCKYENKEDRSTSKPYLVFQLGHGGREFFVEGPMVPPILNGLYVDGHANHVKRGALEDWVVTDLTLWEHDGVNSPKLAEYSDPNVK